MQRLQARIAAGHYPADLPRVCMVAWEDSHVYELYQMAQDALPTPTMIHTIGFVVRDDETHMVLARERIGPDWRGVIAIPASAIQHCVWLT